jgi:hypothetical protein
METQKILLGGATFSVPRLGLVTNCPKFLANRDLLKSPYRVVSTVGEEALLMFLATLESTKPELTTGNIDKLFLLCEEFGFTALLSQVSDFRSQHAVVEDEAVIDDEARKGVYRVEEQNQQQDRAFGLLQQEIADLREEHLREIAGMRAEFAQENRSLWEELAKSKSNGKRTRR